MYILDCCQSLFIGKLNKRSKYIYCYEFKIYLDSYSLLRIGKYCEPSWSGLMLELIHVKCCHSDLCCKRNYVVYPLIFEVVMRLHQFIVINLKSHILSNMHMIQPGHTLPRRELEIPLGSGRSKPQENPDGCGWLWFTCFHNL